MSEKYSKVYLSEGTKHFGFRYNYDDAVLEYVTLWDYAKDKITGECVDILLDDWDVATSIGLSKENWEDNPQYWIEAYKDEIDEEVACLAEYI
jgi:hypothetical protein